MPSLELLRQFVNQAPSDAFPRYGLAMELIKQGQHDEARTVFQALQEQFSSYVPQYLMHANLLIKMQRSDEARAVLAAGIAAAQKAGNGHALSELEGLLDSL